MTEELEALRAGESITFSAAAVFGLQLAECAPNGRRGGYTFLSPHILFCDALALARGAHAGRFAEFGLDYVAKSLFGRGKLSHVPHMYRAEAQFPA